MDTSPTEESYRHSRIQALKRNGSIEALLEESAAIKRSIKEHFHQASISQRVFDLTFVVRQAERAHTFETEATWLDKNRPAGAAGLAS